MNDAVLDPANAPANAPESDPAPDAEVPTLTLQAALKLAGFAATGGQAKQLIQGGDVRVNGAVETRRKHKLVEGDEIAVGSEVFVLELAPEPDDVEAGVD